MEPALVKHYAIKDYIRKLHPLLVKRYGKQKQYNEVQIKDTIKSANLNYDYICFAYAMYLPELDFVSLHKRIGENCNYNEMRGEIAGTFFNGDDHFQIDTISNVCQQMTGFALEDSFLDGIDETTLTADKDQDLYTHDDGIFDSDCDYFDY